MNIPLINTHKVNVTDSKSRVSPYLQIDKASKQFGDVVALNRASLSVERGETLALLGPSGCGKTTLLRIIAGLDTPDDGSVTLDGATLVDGAVYIRPEQRRVGMVFQGGALFPHMTVLENVRYGVVKDSDSDTRVAEALELVDMVGFESRFPSSLSGGQAQRIALARALAPHPDVLLLDEPFASLDAELRIRVRADVVGLLRNLEITAVFVTHDQEEAFVVGDHVAVMRGGRIAQAGTPAELYDRPESAWVARFVGDADVLSGIGCGAEVSTPIGMIPIHGSMAGPCDVVVRPEHVALAIGTSAIIETVEFYGHDTAYRVRQGESVLTVRVMSAPRFAVGDAVDARYMGPPVVAFAKSELVPAPTNGS